MSQKADLLRVAPPKGTQHATNRGFGATGSATQNATSTLKAIANAAYERNRARNRAQQDAATERNKQVFSEGDLLRPVAMDPDEHNGCIDWAGFVAHCTMLGATSDDVDSMFKQQDIDDLCEEPASKLHKHAQTIVDAIKRARASRTTDTKAVNPKPAGRSYSMLVRCGRCAHFQLNPRNPGGGLGNCAVRHELAMALPSRQIDCKQYNQRNR